MALLYPARGVSAAAGKGLWSRGGKQDRDLWASQPPTWGMIEYYVTPCLCSLLKEFEAMGEQAGDRGRSLPGALTLVCAKGLFRLPPPNPSFRIHWRQAGLMPLRGSVVPLSRWELGSS